MKILRQKGILFGILFMGHVVEGILRIPSQGLYYP